MLHKDITTAAFTIIDWEWGLFFSSSHKGYVYLNVDILQIDRVQTFKFEFCALYTCMEHWVGFQFQFSISKRFKIKS